MQEHIAVGMPDRPPVMVERDPSDNQRAHKLRSRGARIGRIQRLHAMQVVSMTDTYGGQRPGRFR
jgi:hypothetical protein